MMQAMAGMVLALAVLGIPDLTDAQRAQLESADDGSLRLDEGALYPLLENVLEWEPGDRRGAQVPDYPAIRTQPAAWRGELLLIEGTFAGRPRRYTLRRPGPWGEALTEWAVIVQRQPEEVAVVYFVDPRGTLMEQAPRPGQQVRLAGRFYKLWTDEDLQGRERQFLTFVARSAETVPGAGGARGVGGSGPMLFVLMLIMVVALLVVLWRVRAMTHREPGPRRPRRSATEVDGTTADGEREAEAVEAPLPDDPGEALAELERRRREGHG